MGLSVLMMGVVVIIVYGTNVQQLDAVSGAGGIRQSSAAWLLGHAVGMVWRLQAGLWFCAVLDCVLRFADRFSSVPDRTVCSALPIGFHLFLTHAWAVDGCQPSVMQPLCMRSAAG